MQGSDIMTAQKTIKKILIDEEMTLTKLIKTYNDYYNENDTIQNLSNKLSRGSLRYNEAEKIAKALGYQIKWYKE